MRFSIIIPTYNEAADIAQTLDCLLQLDYPDYEILVVDESRDATPQIVQSYLQRPAAQNRLRYLRQTRATGRSAGRNQGILESSGEVVMILNADVLLPTDFLQRIAVHYQAGADYVVVYSQVANIEHLLPRYVQACHDLYYGVGSTTDQNWSEGFSCRRAAALAVGLFPEGVVTSTNGKAQPLLAGEDGWFGEQLLAHGYRRVQDFSIAAPHVMPTRWGEFWRQRVGRGYGVPQIWAWNNKVTGLHLLGRVLFHVLAGWAGIVLLLPTLYHAWRLANCSVRGMRDFPAFIIVRATESLANTVGLLRGYWSVRR